MSNVMDRPPSCPVCGREPVLVDRSSVSRFNSGSDKVWKCGDESCDTYVGCHPGTTWPVGTMAGAELRRLRRKAHGAFDYQWKHGGMTRRAAYRLLRDELGLKECEAHIGMMDEEMCRRTIKAFDARKSWKVPKC